MNEWIFHGSSERFWQHTKAAKCGTLGHAVAFRPRVPESLQSPSSWASKENLFRMQSFEIHFKNLYWVLIYNGRNNRGHSMNSYVHSVGFGEQSTDVLLSRENFYMEIICLKLLVGPRFQLILLLCHPPSLRLLSEKFLQEGCGTGKTRWLRAGKWGQEGSDVLRPKWDTALATASDTEGATVDIQVQAEDALGEVQEDGGSPRRPRTTQKTSGKSDPLQGRGKRLGSVTADFRAAT